ncbi:MAG TPA: hypothetical protein VKG80_00370, partial [Trebonia sp.]|nr:hypothetical protein [Trebonia sp.]
PKTNPKGVDRCCVASTFLIARSTGFIAPTLLFACWYACPASRRANSPGLAMAGSEGRVVLRLGLI